jgi:amidase
VIDHYRIIESIRAARIRFFGLWKQIDILLVPTVGIVAPPVEWAPWDQTPEEHSARFRNFSNVTQAFNTSGQPAISLPLAWSQAGMPIGVQLVGRPLEDGLVLRLAAQFEQASPWLDRISQAGRGLQATQ